jgi:hypothetical protein
MDPSIDLVAVALVFKALASPEERPFNHLGVYAAAAIEIVRDRTVDAIGFPLKRPRPAAC